MRNKNIIEDRNKMCRNESINELICTFFQPCDVHDGSSTGADNVLVHYSLEQHSSVDKHLGVWL